MKSSTPQPLQYDGPKEDYVVNSNDDIIAIVRCSSHYIFRVLLARQVSNSIGLSIIVREGLVGPKLSKVAFYCFEKLMLALNITQIDI
jgi:hypothetical protein